MYILILADYIVSFSVFEHVYDRLAYLRTAKARLAEDGIFYLNYDDGHFRNMLDLNAPRTWPVTLRVWLHNLLSSILAKFGWVAQFQQRVVREEIDYLVGQVGFDVSDVFYSNLGCMKGLRKTIPQDAQDTFLRLWLGLEETLNSDFLFEQETIQWGDRANLWKVMDSSRTLVLRHRR